MTDNGYWRWNTNITWHYFCSVGSSAAMAREATNEFIRYHHIRTLLYFSVCTMESALNAAMRQHMKGEAEDDIVERLRKPRFREKVSAWPSEIGGREISFEPDFWEFFEQHKQVRDEITHPKQRDHSVYRDLDQTDPTAIEKAIARALVSLRVAQGNPWPYWLLSWNYVGMNADPTFPMESNNLNGFYHSLPVLGIRWNGMGQMAFERQGMSSLQNFDELDALMRKLTMDVEPFSAHFPHRPRLTRRWWDTSFLQDDFKRSNAN
ncbi:hypothetical protein AB9E29_21600 [Rhizobium leguminosarum]|uniref:hypothetical protein n=1 Tax=Rhizobium leguminosarum TaxID=384 RepID=UPI003F9976CC